MLNGGAFWGQDWGHSRLQRAPERGEEMQRAAGRSPGEPLALGRRAIWNRLG